MEPPSRVLIVDDDPLIRDSLYALLRKGSYEAEIASDGREAIAQLARQPFHVALLDWRMPGLHGLELLTRVRTEFPQVAIVIMTGYGNVESAVAAIRAGAVEYIMKPVEAETLQGILERLFPERGEGPSGPGFEGMVGEHPSMQRVFRLIQVVGQSDATVLMEGESGTGKRLAAHACHRCHPQRRERPFVEMSCGALPETLLESELFGHVRGAFTGAFRDREGRFEQANGGTLLLDEIDACSPAMQVKLLRVIQQRTLERVGEQRCIRVDVRLIAATNQDLWQLVQAGRFREDLYYRLNVIKLRVPSLRERASDIPLLADYFVRRLNRITGKQVLGFTPDAVQALVGHTWPGNVRELENAIEHAVILSSDSRISREDLPESVLNRVGAVGPEPAALVPPPPAEGFAGDTPSAPRLKDALRDPERQIILKVLRDVRWNRTQAAHRLGINRTTLYHKLKRLQLVPDRWSASS